MGITAAVDLSRRGPQGMKELGETILQKSHYAAAMLDELDGVEVPFTTFFKEFPVTFNKPVREVNEALLGHKIFGGKNLTTEYPELGEAALYCVTEMHSLGMIDTLGAAIREVLA